LREGGLNAIRDEGEGRAALKDEGRAGVRRQDEDRMMERRILAPPSVPGLVRGPGARVASEHISSHNRRADVGEELVDDGAALVRLPALLAVCLTPGGGGENPLMQAHSADTEGVLHALIRSGDEAVERYRNLEPQLGHGAPPAGAYLLQQYRCYDLSWGSVLAY